MPKNEVEMSEELQVKLAAFDANKPLVINASEIEGLDGLFGRFVFKRPTIKDRLKIGILTNKYKENSDLDTLHENLAYILATFEITCTEHPENFKFDEMYELAPLFSLYDRYSEWLEFFRQKLQLSKKGSSEKK